MKYLHKFANDADFEAAYNGSDYVEPWVSYTERATEKIRIRITNDSSYYTVTYLGPVTLDTRNTEGYAGVNTNSEDGPKAFFSSSNTINVGDTLDFIYDTGEGSYDYDDGAETVISVEVLKISKVDYNKRPFTGDLIVNLDNLDECNYAEIVGANDNINLGSTYALECEHTYDISSEADVITDPPSTLRVRFICNGEIHDEDLSTAGDSAWSLTSGEGQEHELMVFVQDDPCSIYVGYGDGE